MINKLKSILHKGFKFGIVGILSTIINYGVFVFLYKVINVYYLISSISGYVLGLLFGYYINKNWTFSAQIIQKKVYIIKYVNVYLISLVSSQSFLFFLVEFWSIRPQYANILAIVLSAVINFSGINLLVFNKTEKSDGA